MADLQSIQSALPTASQENQESAKSGGKDDALGKMDFLKLLVTQLENQDPLDPSDPTEMTAQLAQYSSLEQLTNISESMEGLDAMKTAYEQNAALSMLGKNVQLEGNTFTFQNEPVPVGYSLEQPAESVEIQILDASGGIVDTIEGLQGTVGEHTVEWDGTDADGKSVPAGEYQFVVGAQDAEGNVMEPTPQVMAEVQGVDYGSGGQTLLTSAGSVALEDIRNVTQTTSQ